MTTDLFVEQCRYLLFQAEPMLDGLRDEHLNIEPIAGNKTAGWLLGHLCITGDFGRRLCGRKAICPPEWRTMFSPGTTSLGDVGFYPPMVDLCLKFREVYADLCDAILNADEASLSAADPFAPARP